MISLQPDQKNPGLRKARLTFIDRLEKAGWDITTFTMPGKLLYLVIRAAKSDHIARLFYTAEMQEDEQARIDDFAEWGAFVKGKSKGWDCEYGLVTFNQNTDQVFAQMGYQIHSGSTPTTSVMQEITTVFPGVYR